MSERYTMGDLERMRREAREELEHDQEGEREEDRPAETVAERSTSEEDAPRQDPQTTRCEVCNGWGETLTGSRIAPYLTRTCSTCGGRGYVELTAPPSEEPESKGEPWPAEYRAY